MEVRDMSNRVRKVRTTKAGGLFCGLLAVVLGLVLTAPIQAAAQSQGNNAVYNASSGVVGSSAFIDASAFANGSDICNVLYVIISSSSYPSTGAVIDARGLNVGNAVYSGINLTCAYSPWTSSSGSTLNPATILLPLTQIVIDRTWALPNGSRVVGKMPGFAPQASLQANANFSGTAMIQMGTSCPTNGCTGVSVEHVTLDANNEYIDTIDNTSSVEQSYVNDVNLKNVGLTGLYVTAPNSGPYSNIRFTASHSSSTNPPQTPKGVDIEAQTKGFHGITAAGPSGGDPTLQTAGHAAIYVNASNNSVEDVHVEGFWDAVEVGVGASVTVSNVMLSNINGASSGFGEVQNTIHICGPNSNTTNGSCASAGTVKDVTVLQAETPGEPSYYPSALQDDVTGTTIGSVSHNFPSTAAMYILGEPVPSNSTSQYSRFSVSPSFTQSGTVRTVVATWGVGTAAPANISCSTPGALYSNTNGTPGSTIYVCTDLSGSLLWKNID
jgi:hypothetical protein